MAERRVVVTGIGAVTPLGQSAQETWKNALEGRSGIAPITLFDVKDCPVTIAGEAKGFDLCSRTQKVNAKDVRKMGRFTQLGVAAGLEAYEDSGLDAIRSRIPAERIGVNIGVGMGGLPEIEAIHQDLLNKGYRRVTPFLVPIIIPNIVSGHLSILLNLKGPNLCNITACASSAHSIGESFKLIQRGAVDVMLAGGAESVISPLGIGGFASMKALSTRNDAPQKASRPYDVGRDGFVMAEGGAALILEEYEFAKKRGAKIYGEVKGYGASGDAFHITLPAEDGDGGYRSMKLALEDAGLNPSQVGYVNSHGTSTPAGDAEEARAIAKVFAHQGLNVSSTKSMTGHLLGASGAIESIFSLLALRESRIPPTINLDQLDPVCAELGLDFTPNRAVEKRLDYTLSNSFGFGGTNASLIFGKI